MFVVAHLGHWYESVLYAAPMVIIGSVLWWTAKRERDREAAEDGWEGEDDPQWNDDPRLRDD
ncbi:MAG: hypothetical protein Q7T55_18515 [Solirubrobacteraceae bacterium]|nr:hypothetical protein [Solirubrobacteraceae bacterium]